jgi:hypothetical protein
MAEPFGIAAGAVGIAAAFTACVDCFGYVQLGRHFGRDFQTDVLALWYCNISEGARLCFPSAEEVGETESTKVDERSQNLPSVCCVRRAVGTC